MFLRTLLVFILGVSTGFSADLYTFKALNIAKGIECVIGDLNPPTKANKGFVSNVCYVDLGKGLVILDAGPSYRFAEEFARFATQRTGKKIQAVVITNYHDDRLYGASYYARHHIPVIAHKSIVSDIQKNPDKFRRLPAILSPSEFNRTKLVTPDTLFEKEYTLKGSQREVKLLKLSPVSEEHSDIAVWVPDAGWLFAGNIVFNGRLLNYTPNSDMKGWIQALETISAMHPASVLGGHGAEHDAKAHLSTLSYLRSLQKQVKTAYDHEVDLSELMQHIDTSRFKALQHYEALNRSNASHYYKQLEWAE